MPYTGYTESRKRANLKYQESMKRIAIWATEEEKKEIEKRAGEAGKSVNRYMLDLAIGKD